MYLLITTQLSRFPRFYLHLLFVIEEQNMSPRHFRLFFLYPWYSLSLFLARWHDRTCV